MKVLKNIFIKIKENRGDAALETALVIAITLPMLLLLIVGGYQFFMNQADNNALNFDAGRYASVAGCYIDEDGLSQGIANIGDSGEFANYNIYLNDNLIHIASDPEQYIKFICEEDSQKGNTIRVITKMRSTPFGRIFPIYSARSALYTQEAPGK